jgi:hypothetical protein
MTVTRRADTLTPRDVGRTVAGVDAPTGDTFSGILQSAHYNETDDYVCVHINRYPQLLRRHDLVQVTGAVVAHTAIVGNIHRKETA